MVDMVLRQVLPAALSYTNSLCQLYNNKSALGASSKAESGLIMTLSKATDRLYENCLQLQCNLDNIPENLEESVHYCKNIIVYGMDAVRADADLLESLTDKSCWPYPTYSDLLFY